MFDTMKPVLAAELPEDPRRGPAKSERVIATPQGASVKLEDGREVLVFCANNYLGLSSHRA